MIGRRSCSHRAASSLLADRSRVVTDPDLWLQIEADREMVEAGASLPQIAASKSGRRGAEVIGRFRKPIVIASLISGDLVAALAAISLGGALMQLIGVRLADKYAAIPFLILLFFSAGLYAGSGPSPYERFRLRMIAVIGFLVIEILVGLPASQPAPLVVGEASSAICLILFGHYVDVMIRTLLMHLNLWGAPTAVVGCGDDGCKAARMLMRHPEAGLTPIGFIATSDDEGRQNPQLPLPLIGTIGEPDLILDRVEVAIFSSAREVATVTSGSRAWIPSCQLLLLEDTLDIQSLWLRTRMLGGATGIEIRRDLRLGYNRMIKRAIDILLAIPIALLVTPVIAVLALVTKLVDPGPAFYVQDRIGRNGTVLRILKLRTMYADAERRLEEHLSRDPQARAEWQRFFKLSRDPRVLPTVGNIIRRFSLDELPQLWNVIRGEMSLVGPRPFPAYHMKSFDAEFQVIRVSVQPGITGMWQVSSRSDGDLQVQEAQDLFYIRNWSIWLDLYILLQTLPAVLNTKGAR
jgi:Undecaprenyl-phosphate galactose phosphotransferase WbaP